ncbi:hypothetical protein GPLA_4338 [Paraglaciecola polaris LMG 21857]|uniref:Uncharacterized protein n=1 Tax=Paraglaciecola polaris LMG 21857 TaxID=1129793 RepID=K6ZYB3_9ALTE|nr:hypothetical protein GPLA_4338 [Paraglaciecola polaris LMG 21857]
MPCVPAIHADESPKAKDSRRHRRIFKQQGIATLSRLTAPT